LVIGLVAVAAGLALPGTASATPDEAPANLHVSSSAATSITVAWDAPATDWPYVVTSITGPSPLGGTYGGNSWSDSDPSHSYTFGALVCGSSYTISVAFDEMVGGTPGPATTLTEQTAPCTHGPPSAPTGLVGVQSGSGVSFSWDAPAELTVTNVSESISGPGVHTSSVVSVTTSYTSPTVICGETYTLTIAWLDDQGQVSPSVSATATAPDCPAPTEPAPTGLHLTGMTTKTLTYAWDASPTPIWQVRTSPSGTAPFVYAMSSTTSKTDSRLKCGTTYTPTVQFVFSDGTVSLPAQISASTDACPIVARTDPATEITSTSARLNATVTTSGLPTEVSFLFGPAGGSPQRVYPAGTLPGSATPTQVSVDVSELSPNAGYAFSVVAKAGTQQVSGRSLSFHTLLPQTTPTTPTPTPTTPTPAATPAPCVVPKLRGLTLARAKRALRKAHCVAGKVVRKKASAKFKNCVIASRPGARKSSPRAPR
jgi:hypothetical protein